MALTSVHFLTAARLRDAPRAMRAARTLASAARAADGCRFARGLATGAFPRLPVPRLTPRRWAILAEWSDPEALEAFTAAAAFTAATARFERCELRLEAVRATGAWEGWQPDVDGVRALDDGEPLVALIHGVVRARHLTSFWRGVARVRRADPAACGMTVGMGLSDRLLGTTSFSVWRTTRQAEAFAFGPGRHRDVMTADQRGRWHHDELFVRYRVLAAAGSLAGLLPLR